MRPLNLRECQNIFAIQAKGKNNNNYFKCPLSHSTSKGECNLREAVLGEYNDAVARKLTATYMQTFLFLLSFSYSSLLYYPASTEYQGSSQPHHEG